MSGGTASGSSARHNKILSEPRSGEEYEQKGSPTLSLDESIGHLPLLKRCLERSLMIDREQYRERLSSLRGRVLEPPLHTHLT